RRDDGRRAGPPLHLDTGSQERGKVMLDLWLAALLDSSLKGLALCLGAAAAALALRRASAAARHLVWRLAFAGLLALPVLAGVLPKWRVPMPGLGKPAQVTTSSLQGPHLPGPPLNRLDSPRSSVGAGLAPTREGTIPSPTGKETAGSATVIEPAAWTPSWQAIAFAVWLAGALAVLAPLGAALLRLRWQRRLARPIEDGSWTGLLGRLRQELAIHREVELVAGGEGAMPMTWGWRRPVVLLPAGAGSWPESRRRAVLLHELSHVVRGDYPAQLASEVVRTLYWLNPLVWMAARPLR